MVRAVRRLVPLVLIFAFACSGGSTDASDESADPDKGSTAFSLDGSLQPDGPLRGIGFTGHVDREAPKIRPTLSFTTEDTEVTAVIGLGDLDEGSTVVVTWYRVAGLQQREALFSHEITVDQGGRAFSQGVAPTGLAPGIYDTEATMDGHVVHTPWVVQEAGGSATGSTGSTAQAASGDEDWNVPDGGDSWSDDGTDLPPTPTAPTETCSFVTINGAMTPIADVKATAWWSGRCTTGSLTATVAGPPVTLASSDSLGGPTPVPHLYGASWACDLPGGSDMPGTVVHLEASGSGGGSADYTLPDNGETLVTLLEGRPEAGGRVEPGQQIDVIAMAMVMAPALGVQKLTLEDGTTVIGSVGNQSGSSEAQECDPRRFSAGLTATYDVPSDPPPIIELCATGVGFDGTESKDCIRYYTGEVWTGSGTFTSSATYPQGGGVCKDAVEIAYTFGIGDDGGIEGTGVATHTSEAVCPFPMSGTQWETMGLSVSGHLEGSDLSLSFANAGALEPAGSYDAGGFGVSLALGSGTVDLTVQGTSAVGTVAFSASSGNPPAVYEASGPVTASCTSGCGSG